MSIVAPRPKERNTAPGTEADPPRRSRYDLRSGAVEVIA
jgi:hypothetical protein